MEKDKILRLSEVNNMEDVNKLSCAISPGGHCPLFGVSLALKSISGISIIFVGTKECTYYAKTTTFEQMGYSKNAPNVILAVMEDKDLVFGIKDLKSLIEEEARKDDTKYVLIVTSCAVELIGEDIEGIVYMLNKQYDCVIKVIKTEHFKTSDYYIGIENSYAALVDGMSNCNKKKKTYNIIGSRYAGIENSEVVSILKDNGWNINTIFPYGAGYEDIMNITRAEFNIVTDYTGLEMAKTLKEKFGMEYIRFDMHFNIENIVKSYKRIEEITMIKVDRFIETNIREIKEQEEKLRNLVNDKTFIYGHIIYYPIELCAYLSNLGMKPLLIQIRNLYDNDINNKKTILNNNSNPYISKNANLLALEDYYKKLKPDVYIGSEMPERLKRHNIGHVIFSIFPAKVGFDVVKNALLALKKWGKEELNNESF